jgi:transcription elongation GreA/GreB family factor
MILREVPLPGAILAIPDRATRDRAFALVKGIVPNRWHSIYAAALDKEEDMRTLQTLLGTLEDEAPTIFRDAAHEILRAPAAHPRPFLALARRLVDGPMEGVASAIDLAGRIVATLHEETLRPHRAGLRDLLSDARLLDRALAEANTRQAKSLLSEIERSPDLEEFRKRELRESILAKFPEFEEVKEEHIWSTPEAAEAKQKELEHLVKVEIPKNSEQIRIAREHGDLRENFEYKSARHKHELLSSRAHSLATELAKVKPLDPARIDTGEVRPGTRVSLRHPDGGAPPRTVTLLGPWDSDPDRGIYSYLAPLAAEMLGKKPGESVRLGDETLVVERIEPWR